MTNNRNPNALKKREVQQKSQDLDVVRATVLDTIPEIHSVRVNPRGDSAPFVAPVVAPMYGSQTLPDVGERVMVLFLTATSGIVLGSVYLLDGEDPPNKNGGDLVFGNDTGSHVTIHEDGHISVITEGTQRVDVDHQAASAYLDTNYSLPSGGTYNKVPFDTIEDDPEGLFNTANNSIEVLSEGLYHISASTELATPKQNNQYQIAIFINGVERKRISKQSAVNEPLSLQVQTQVNIDAESVIDIRMSNNSGTSRIVLGSPVTTEFNVRRAGV